MSAERALPPGPVVWSTQKPESKEDVGMKFKIAKMREKLLQGFADPAPFHFEASGWPPYAISGIRCFWTLIFPPALVRRDEFYSSAALWVPEIERIWDPESRLSGKASSVQRKM